MKDSKLVEWNAASLGAARDRVLTCMAKPQIGLTLADHHTDGSGFTVDFRSAEQAVTAIEALHRIIAARAHRGSLCQGSNRSARSTPTPERRRW